MLAGVDEADVGCRGRGAEGEEVAEGGYRCVGGDGYGDGFFGLYWLAFDCNCCAVLGLSDVLSPDSSLTNIWKLSEDGDDDVEVEEAVDEEREERMLGDTVGE